MEGGGGGCITFPILGSDLCIVALMSVQWKAWAL